MQATQRDRRFWLIELVCYWEGRINASQLAQLCSIGRQQASSDLVRYREQCPDNLRYDASCKAYLPQEPFLFGWISGSVTEYLGWISGSTPSRLSTTRELRCEGLRHPSRNVSAVLMRKLIWALREQRRIEVDYVSLKNPDCDGRVIVPHTFVNTCLRWHLRAWCEKSGAYRDFVLSRFRPEANLLDLSSQGAAQDDAWNTEITLILQPDPRLSEAKRKVLFHDYAMQDGTLHLPVRAALAQYLLQEMHINYKVLDGNPDAQQLILMNVDDVRQWLF